MTARSILNLLFLVWMSIHFEMPVQAQSTGASPEHLIRVVWGTNRARLWEGHIEIDQGSLAPTHPLGVSPSAACEVRAIDARSCRLEALQPSSFGGSDFLVRAPLESKITFALNSTTSNSPTSLQATYSLRELVENTQSTQSPEGGMRVAISRAPSDMVRVHAAVEHCIVAPGTSLPMEVELCQSPWASTSAKLTWKWEHRGFKIDRDERSVSIDLDAQGSSERTLLHDLTAPLDEGVYQLHIHIEPRKRMGNLLRSGETIERVVEFVVLSPTLPSMEGTASKTIPLHFAESATPPLLRKWANKVQGAHGPDSLRLEPNQTATIPLEHLTAPKPHRIRLHYESDSQTRCVASIIEWNEQGQIDGTTLDAAFEIEPGSTREQSLLFWPRSQHARLVVWNPSASPIFIERAELITGDASLTTHPLNANSSAKSSFGSATPNSEVGRQVMLSLDRPYFYDTFGGPKWYDPKLQRSIDGWETFYYATNHLIEYCKTHGYTGVSLPIYSDGSCLFPSRVLSTSPRYDSGIFASDGRDLRTKDVVELMMRMMDRADLRLVVTLDFNAPIPDLEKRSDSSTDIEQISIDRKTWQEQLPSARTRRIQYDPMSPRFQQTLLDFVREIHDRYQSHPSWAGVALRLSPKSHLLYAGDRWGYQDSTVTLYEKQLGARLPRDKAQRNAMLMQSAYRTGWLQWRSEQTSQLFLRAAKILADQEANRYLFLQTAGLFEQSPDSTGFLDPQRSMGDPMETLMAHGLDLPSLQKAPNLIVSQSSMQFHPTNIGSHRWAYHAFHDLKLNEQLAMSDHRAFQSVQRVLALETPQSLRANADVPTPLWLAPLTPSDDRRSSGPTILEHLDCDFLFEQARLPLHSDFPLEIRHRHAVSNLPPIPMHLPKSLAQRPPQWSVIRSVQWCDHTYIELSNPTAWPISLQLMWNQNASSKWAWVYHPQYDSEPSIQTASLPNNLELLPGASYFLRVADPQLELRAFKETPHPQAIEDLKNQLDRLNEYIHQTNSTQKSTMLPNGLFEEPSADSKIPYWTTSMLPSATIQLDSSEPHQGERCLRMENRGTQGVAWLQSPPFLSSSSGRLAVEFYLRSDLVTENLKLQVRLTGMTAIGEKKEVVRRVPLSNPQGKTVVDPTGKSANKPSWKYVMLPLLDETSSHDMESFQISFDLEGIGAIWLDEVSVFDLYLTDDERKSLRADVLAAKRSLDSGEAILPRRVLQSYLARYLQTYAGPREEPTNSHSQDSVFRSISTTGTKRNAATDGSLDSAKTKPQEADSDKTWLQKFRDNWGRRKTTPDRSRK
ncbi:MAG: family 10 glycosylhydrolase [Pirellulales bacterium]